MNRSFKEAVLHRRSCYSISNSSPISDEKIKEIIDFAVLHVPSAFNSQSTRVVLLLGEQHRKVWEITKEVLQSIVDKETFVQTKAKIEGCFECGYGTVLFFEDEKVVADLQRAFPTYKDNFPLWSLQTSAMHQFAVWTMLEDAGLGASLQHYNPLIDRKVAETWNISPDWRLIAEMPFGTPTESPGERTYEPLEERVFLFK